MQNRDVERAARAAEKWQTLLCSFIKEEAGSMTELEAVESMLVTALANKVSIQGHVVAAQSLALVAGMMMQSPQQSGAAKH